MTTSINHFSSSRLPITASGFFTLKAFAALMIAGISFSTHAQSTAAPAPTPSSQITSMRTDVRRVDVDVVVTDSQGRPVTGLMQQDFKIEEDKAPQTLRFLDVHTVAPESNYVAPKISALPPNTFINLAKAPESGTPTVILYDALNTPLTEQAYGHKELLDLIRHRRPGTQMAIFILTGKLHLLQGFTEDTSLLSMALASKKGSPQTTTLLAPSSFELITTPTAVDAANAQTDDGFFMDFLAIALKADRVDELQLQDQRVDLTISALTDIGRFLASMPGRKDLIWLSSTFPVGIIPDPANDKDSKPPYRDVRDYSGQIKKAADLLNLSHVSVYPVDIRGLRLNADLAASSNSSFQGNPNFLGAADSLAKQGSTGKFPTTRTSLNLSQQTFIMADEATRMTMDSIADQTGGHAFYGTNGLQEAVNTAMLSGSTYYSLNYLPTNGNYDGTLRHIKVTLKNSGYNLAYRKTYFADDLAAAAHAVADAPENPLTSSLERGTPLSHDLFLEAHLDADGPPVLATPAQMQLLSQYAALQSTTKKAKQAPCTLPVLPSATASPVILTAATLPVSPSATASPVVPNPTPSLVILSAAKDPRMCPRVMMQQYYISYGLIARQLSMPVDDTGAHLSSLEMAVIAYDEDGRKLNGQDTHIDDTIPAPRYAKLASDGYHVVQSIAVPVTTSSIRLAVRDTRGNRIGSLEIQLPLTPRS